MTPGRDDDALSWDGDDDPTLDTGVSASDARGATVPSASSSEPDAAADEKPSTAGAALPDGFTAVGKGSDRLGSATEGTADPGADPKAPEAADAAAGAPRSIGNAGLIAIGVFVGVYVLLSIGWLLGAARLQLVAALFLEPVAFQVTLWLAVLALPLWFVTVLWLTRGGRAWVRFTLLAAGALLLIPWPFVLAGAVL